MWFVKVRMSVLHISSAIVTLVKMAKSPKLNADAVRLVVWIPTQHAIPKFGRKSLIPFGKILRCDRRTHIHSTMLQPRMQQPVVPLEEVQALTVTMPYKWQQAISRIMSSMSCWRLPDRVCGFDPSIHNAISFCSCKEMYTFTTRINGRLWYFREMDKEPFISCAFRKAEKKKIERLHFGEKRVSQRILNTFTIFLTF